MPKALPNLGFLFFFSTSFILFGSFTKPVDQKEAAFAELVTCIQNGIPFTTYVATGIIICRVLIINTCRSQCLT